MSHARPRLLVIGSSGFVGGWLSRLGREQWSVIEGARQPRCGDANEGENESVTIDLAQPEGLPAAFDAARPDVVILTAAMADIDRCEREPELAERVNQRGAVAVARECARAGARLIFTSTDAVFDGLAPPYNEEAPPTPVNHYGRTKAAAEAGIREILPGAVIARPSLVLGFSAPARRGSHNNGTGAGAPQAANNSYLDKLSANLRAGKTVATPTTEWRNPIDVVTFAQALLELASRDAAAGVFHIGASDKMSRYELARGLANELGASPELIWPQSKFPPERAPRGRDDFLVCRRLPELTGFVVPTCRQVIHRAVHGTS